MIKCLLVSPIFDPFLCVPVFSISSYFSVFSLCFYFHYHVCFVNFTYFSDICSLFYPFPFSVLLFSFSLSFHSFVIFPHIQLYFLIFFLSNYISFLLDPFFYVTQCFPFLILPILCCFPSSSFTKLQ